MAWREPLRFRVVVDGEEEYFDTCGIIELEGKIVLVNFDTCEYRVFSSISELVEWARKEVEGAKAVVIGDKRIDL